MQKGVVVTLVVVVILATVFLISMNYTINPTPNTSSSGSPANAGQATQPDNSASIPTTATSS